MNLRPITMVPCECLNPNCDWAGVTGECETGGDDGTELVCPDCRFEVLIHYSAHERNPDEAQNH